MLRYFVEYYSYSNMFYIFDVVMRRYEYINIPTADAANYTCYLLNKYPFEEGE